MSRCGLRFLPLAMLLTGLSSLAQSPGPAPKPETARQALIEMITKGGDSLRKHLTLEVQDLLKSSNKNPAMFDSFKPEPGMETFEAGDVLLAYGDPKGVRYEVRIENDDLAGDEDTLLLSVHALRGGEEQDEPWGLMSSHFSVQMKQQ